MIMMAVIVMVVLLMVAQLVALKDVQTVNLISHHMDLNAAIQLQMSLALIVPRLKALMDGTVLDVVALVILVVQLVVQLVVTEMQAI